MPFTISHAAVAYPLRHSRISLDAVVVSSLMPDFSYFLSYWIGEVEGHTLMGLLLFSLPASFVAVYLSRFCKAEKLLRIRTSKAVLPTVSGVIVGSGSHVLLDLFTHSSILSRDILPALSNQLFGRPIYSYLQHGSSLLGMVLILAVLFRARDHIFSSKTQVQLLTAVFLGLSVGVFGLSRTPIPRLPDNLFNLLVNLVYVCVFAVFLASYLLLRRYKTYPDKPDFK